MTLRLPTLKYTKKDFVHVESESHFVSCKNLVMYTSQHFNFTTVTLTKPFQENISLLHLRLECKKTMYQICSNGFNCDFAHNYSLYETVEHIGQITTDQFCRK